MDIFKSIRDNQIENEQIVKSVLDIDIQKGKPGQIGEIRVWNGKKYKKQPNGKWLEVSEHGMTKQEHTYQYGKHLRDSEERGTTDEKFKEHIREAHKHSDIADELSDKEHSDEDFNEGENNSNPAPTLDDHAKKASEQALQNAIKSSPDPEVRAAAHKELQRRQSEEKNEMFKKPEDTQGEEKKDLPPSGLGENADKVMQERMKDHEDSKKIESKLFQKDKEYRVVSRGKGEHQSHLIQSTDGSHEVDMQFDSPEEAHKFAKDRGVIISNQEQNKKHEDGKESEKKKIDLYKSDIEHSLSMISNGRTLPSVSELTKKKLSINVGSKYLPNEEDIKNNLESLYPGLELVYDGWVSRSSGGGKHNFSIRNKEERPKKEDKKLSDIDLTSKIIEFGFLGKMPDDKTLQDIADRSTYNGDKDKLIEAIKTSIQAHEDYKVIGSTKSGKPISNKFDQSSTKDYSFQDHSEATIAHMNEAKKHNEELKKMDSSSKEEKDEKNSKLQHHISMARLHHNAANMKLENLLS